MLVKGDLQGATKSKKSRTASNCAPISKLCFFDKFKTILKSCFSSLDEDYFLKLKYINLKKSSFDYLNGLSAFHSNQFYKDWIRTDQNKYYLF